MGGPFQELQIASTPEPLRRAESAPTRQDGGAPPAARSCAPQYCPSKLSGSPPPPNPRPGSALLSAARNLLLRSSQGGSMEDAGSLALGMKALERGYITSVQLRDLLIEHARGTIRDGRAARSMGMILLAGGHLTADQLSSLLEGAASPAPAPVRPALSAPPPGDPALVASNRFGKFELRSVLGRGSMGLVYEAFDT